MVPTPRTNGDLPADMTGTPEAERAFVSMRRLRATDMLPSAGKAYCIDTLTILEESNESYGVTCGEDKATGLFLENDGTLQNVSFESCTVRGSDNVGTPLHIDVTYVMNRQSCTVKSEYILDISQIPYTAFGPEGTMENRIYESWKWSLNRRE